MIKTKIEKTSTFPFLALYCKSLLLQMVDFLIEGHISYTTKGERSIWMILTGPVFGWGTAVEPSLMTETAAVD